MFAANRDGLRPLKPVISVTVDLCGGLDPRVRRSVRNARENPSHSSRCSRRRSVEVFSRIVSDRYPRRVHRLATVDAALARIERGDVVRPPFVDFAYQHSACRDAVPPGGKLANTAALAAVPDDGVGKFLFIKLIRAFQEKAELFLGVT